MASLQIIALSLVELSVGVACSVLAAVAWRYRDREVGRLVVVMAVAASAYSFLAGVLSFVDDPLLWLVLNNIGYPLGAILAVSSLFIVGEFTGRHWLRRPAIVGLLGSFVVVDFVVSVTDPAHNLVIASLTRREGVIAVAHGPLFFVHTIVSLTVVLFAVGLLCIEFPQLSRVYRKQTVVIIAAFVFGMGGFAVQSFRPVHPGIDLSTVGMLGWSTLIFWGVLKRDFLDVVPVGHRRVVESMADPVLTVDNERRVIDSNPAACELADPESNWVGTPVSTFLADYPELASTIESEEDGKFSIEVDGSTRYVTLTSSPIYDTGLFGNTNGTQVACVVVMRDFTEQVRRQGELERANEQLDRAHRRYRSLFENSPLVFWEWDLSETLEHVSQLVESTDDQDLSTYLAENPDEHRALVETIEVVEVNENAVEAYGASSREELVESLDVLVAGQALVAHGRLLEQVFDGNQQFTEEITYETLDGERRHELLEVVVPDEYDDDYSRVLLAATDITERKEREKELRYQKALFEELNESANAGVLVTDTDREILWYNSQFREMWGIPTEILESEKASERAVQHVLEKVANTETFLQATEQLYEPPYEEEKEEIKLVDGRWFERFTAPILGEEGTLYGLLTLTRDITGQKQYEMQIEAQNQRLERLAQVISHDLQTPLSTAEKHLKLLEIELDDPDEPVEASLEDLESTHDRLYRFAEHLPRLARESTDVEGTVECSVADTAEDTWEVVETGSLELVLDGDRPLQADRRRLRQLFENLFANVTQHATEATTVWVQTQETGFAVADDGQGVSEEQGEEIFEYGMSTTDSSGVGLAIVRSIVEAHGWEISVSQSEAGGAKFIVRTT